MLIPSKAKAIKAFEEPEEEIKKIPPIAKLVFGVYNKGEEPMVGFGLAKDLELSESFTLSASATVASKIPPGDSSVFLEDANLSVTAHLFGPVFLTGFAYRERFSGVDFGAGGVLSIASANIGAEWDNDGGIPIFANYVFRLADEKLRIVPCLIYVARTELMGARLNLELDHNDVTLFASVFNINSLQEQNPNPLAVNFQAGLRFEL